ncbi:hypothetical protein B0H14DRAFT_3151309 [Mycena olivaceomarginata]|nr:hypothetical protein B0H14DRAFT_3151309 [Mycena olivaceomarginata]
MQGTWSSKCLEAQGKRVTDHADTVDSIVPGRWVESLLCIADVGSCTTLTSMIAFIKHKYAFCALASYDGLLALQPRWGHPHCAPESVAGTEMSVCVADFVVNAVKYMDCLVEVHDAAAAGLLQLGDGNWKMDPGMMTVGKNSKLGDGNEQLILKHSVSRPAHPALLDLPMNVWQLPYREGRLGAYILRRRELLRRCCRRSRMTRGPGVKEKLTKFHRLLEGDPEAWMGIREDVMPSLMRSTNKYTVGRRSVARVCPCALYSPLRVLIILSTSAGNIKDNDGRVFNFFITFTNSGNPR